jgi:hypothetical protein
LAGLNTRYNELVQAEQVQLAKSQTLERYIEKGKTWIDSLQNQAATQMVLINKLQTDTKQRIVLYDALSKSLKTAQQQDVAHRINEIGVQTDQEAQTTMAAIGAATNARMADMLEAHEDHMVFARDPFDANLEGRGVSGMSRSLIMPARPYQALAERNPAGFGDVRKFVVGGDGRVLSYR